MHSVATGWLWTGFFVFVLCVLAIDILLLKKQKLHVVSTREALCWTIVWIICALVFNLVLWIYLSHTQGTIIAHQKALEFFTGYLIEESLSFDNMFVFIMIFSFFCVPEEFQRRVLLYGVLGAIIMRFVMIFAGVWIINQFHWVLYLFGIFLAFTGIKMFFIAEHEADFSKNKLLIWLKKHLRITETFHNEHFFVRKNRLLYVTPLFLVLIFVEISDLVFALDSIPAIFAVTRDPFIVFTSNIFAIMGLRAIYFLLANMARNFELLKYGIALVLIFIGCKLLIEPWFNIPVLLALSVVASILAASIIFSWIKKKRHENSWKN
ncbi:MAG TPA: TerC family protein [Gammaproteobacteria bacterium]|nr:TerC family protein [Gammaproteobacteria bacterium]